MIILYISRDESSGRRTFWQQIPGPLFRAVRNSRNASAIPGHPPRRCSEMQYVTETLCFPMFSATIPDRVPRLLRETCGRIPQSMETPSRGTGRMQTMGMAEMLCFTTFLNDFQVIIRKCIRWEFCGRAAEECQLPTAKKSSFSIGFTTFPHRLQ